jgi:hypothetical protein
VHEAPGRVGLREMQAGVVIDDALGLLCVPILAESTCRQNGPAVLLPATPMPDIVRGHSMAPWLYIVVHGCKLIGAADSTSHCFTHRSISEQESGLSEMGDAVFELDVFNY